ncbi:MAG: Laccase domain protein YfiH [Alphaproteobacteria bacterium MarineAlpha4_Bin2]|nr:MAG: Laccase domain protein YfiH [Alphaproteobacteria bacterium MarineAlpha4_Bin2]
MTTGNVNFLKAKNLSRSGKVRHAFFTRAGGVSAGVYASLNVGIGSSDDRGNVLENRRRAMAAMGMPANALHTMHQVHGAEVFHVTDKNRWSVDQAPCVDAMVTDQSGIVLGVLTADCVPVLFSDPQAGIVGAAHSGWRGTLLGVLAAAVEAMEALGGDRSNIHAAVGPAIAQQSYEVGPEFRGPFIEVDPNNTRFFKPSRRDGHYMFDLTGCVLWSLEEFGLSSVEHLNFDTCADDKCFFSYRRATHLGEADYGRGLSAICLRA